MVYDGDGSESVLMGPEGSQSIESTFKSVLRDLSMDFTEAIFDGRSDYAPFIEVGIPAGGLFSGAEEEMSAIHAQRFNGEEGVAYDECYHEACDDLENVNIEGFQSMVQASKEVIFRLSSLDSLTQTYRLFPNESTVLPTHQHASGCQKSHLERK